MALLKGLEDGSYTGRRKSLVDRSFLPEVNPQVSPAHLFSTRSDILEAPLKSMMWSTSREGPAAMTLPFDPYSRKDRKKLNAYPQRNCLVSKFMFRCQWVGDWWNEV